MRLNIAHNETNAAHVAQPKRSAYTAAYAPRTHGTPSRSRVNGLEGLSIPQKPLLPSAKSAERWQVPAELWAAANAVAAACRKSFSGQGRPCIECQATAASALEPQPEASESLATLLDFEAKVSPTQAGISLALSTLLCLCIYALTAPPRISPLYSLGMALIFAVSIAVTRVWLVEHQWQGRMRSEAALSDEDSRFSVIDGVNVHWKLHQPSLQLPAGGSSSAADSAIQEADQGPGLNKDLLGFFEASGQEGPQLQSDLPHHQAGPGQQCAVHCYHGFGANTFSWSFVEQQLANRCGAQVTSHDMPGFGLTQRTSDREAYTLEFNGRLGRQIMDSSLAENIDEHQSMEKSKVKRVLIGHSMGAACAAAEATDHPEGVNALILVAPAIIGRNKPKGPINREGVLGAFRGLLSATRAFFQALLARLLAAFVRLTRPIFALALRQSVRRSADAVLVLHYAQQVGRQLKAHVLRNTNTNNNNWGFWEKGLKSAWVNTEGVTPEVVNGYRRPQLVRGWEAGMLEFLAARTRSRRNISHSVWTAWKGVEDPSPAERLAASLAKHPETKVLIIHGKQDRLVPASNSRKLVKMLPNAELLELDQCGHLPQEELPAQFVDAMQRFLAS